MLAWLGCFFAQLSYSLRTARLDSSLFMLATQTLPTRQPATRPARRLHPLFKRGGELGIKMGGSAVMFASRNRAFDSAIFFYDTRTGRRGGWYSKDTLSPCR